MILRLTGAVTTDGDTIYVDGQNLANLVRAAFPTGHVEKGGIAVHGALDIEIAVNQLRLLEQARAAA